MMNPHNIEINAVENCSIQENEKLFAYNFPNGNRIIS